MHPVPVDESTEHLALAVGQLGEPAAQHVVGLAALPPRIEQILAGESAEDG